jgi:hypothetical protein
VDRELVLAGLLIIMVGLTLLGVAPWPTPIRPKRSAREWEQATWRTVWWPSVPVVAIVSVLIGWAIVEPAMSDEPLPLSALAFSGLFGALWARALSRAACALSSRMPVAGTVGLWRPRVVFSDQFGAQLDADAFEAAQLHEAAHVRHRDPLRIWLAQMITDLQWPWPSAQRRFKRWRHVLELARDEEARLAGADGADLAAAVLIAAELHTGIASGATLFEGAGGLEERVARLLAPLSNEDAPQYRANAIALLPVSIAGLLAGLRFGDAFVRTFVRWL